MRRWLFFWRRANRAIASGMRAARRRDWRRAARHYQTALAARPGNAAIWVQLGHALKESGDVAGGEAAYRRALALQPEAADTWLQLGHALKLQGQIDEAASAYVKSAALDADARHAAFELFNLGWGPPPEVPTPAAGLRKDAEPRDDPMAPAGPPSIVFDVSDLVHYFLRARVPTGIQRVQLNVVGSLLRSPAHRGHVLAACFTPHDERWIAVPAELLLPVIDLAVAGGGVDDPAWRRAMGELQLLLADAPPLRFRRGDALVNMGSSWCLQNYFLMVRAAKAQYGVRYIPYVHDCIPVLAPEHFTPDLTRDFANWMAGVFFHADGFLVNSQATAGDLARAAALLGHQPPRARVIRLDACSGAGDPPSAGAAEEAAATLRRHGLDRQEFVLFVATIESRKNHLLAFETWKALIRRRGAARVPDLVCVGNPGWLVDRAMACLAGSRQLRRKVRLLSKISDATLGELYRRCLFTIYPSCYEGWGLPVTESLCHGKLPLIAEVSSLPEAGGEWAEYFDLQSAGDFAAKLERLIDDPGYRKSREAAIRQGFAARSWADIAEEVVASVSFVQEMGSAGGVKPLPAAVGRYYALSYEFETALQPGMVGGEMYRTGTGWWPPGNWGCWIKEAHAGIGFRVDGVAGGVCLCHIGLRGTPEGTADFAVAVAGQDIRETGTLQPDERRWIVLRLAVAKGRPSDVQIELATTGRCDLAHGVARYRHVVTLGVIGFYLCGEDDAAARAGFAKTIAGNQESAAIAATMRPAAWPSP